ncbi:MAG: pyridoxamine 5'-phosphate oxidase family protein [Deltaproteobacteria bacterium]|nr:pyridoxamine 5'-phosphate oxidase family protein [Deltaproteobacteria bacterium]
MAEMNERVQEMLTAQRTIILATSTNDGVPNVVPIHSKNIIDDETILISNQFMGKTLANLRANPKVAITFWDKIEGYQIKGDCTYETSGKLYEETAEFVEAYGKSINYPLNSKGILLIKITDIYNVSPGPHAGEKIA